MAIPREPDEVLPPIVRTFNDPRVVGRVAKVGTLCVFVNAATGAPLTLQKTTEADTGWALLTVA